jgi:hypothetical protein
MAAEQYTTAGELVVSAVGRNLKAVLQPEKVVVQPNSETGSRLKWLKNRTKAM